MWMLAVVPDSFLLYIVNTILAVGAISFFISFFLLHRILNKFPIIAPYHLAIQIISALTLIAGIYLRGGYDTEAAWREKVAKLEQQVAQMEEMSNTLNKNLSEERKKKQKVRVEYYATVKTQIKEVEKQINAECKLDPKVNELVNNAAKNPESKK